MRTFLFGLAVTLALAVSASSARAQEQEHDSESVPALDHVFVLVLENHNSQGEEGLVSIESGTPKARNMSWTQSLRDVSSRMLELLARTISSRVFVPITSLDYAQLLPLRHDFLPCTNPHECGNFRLLWRETRKNASLAGGADWI